MVLSGGSPGFCTAAITSSCQSTCTENPPGLSCGSTTTPLTFTVRLCSAKADCASEAARTSCCAFGASADTFCTNAPTLATFCRP